MSFWYLSDRVFQFAYLYAEFHNVLVYIGHVVIIVRSWPIAHNFIRQNLLGLNCWLPG